MMFRPPAYGLAVGEPRSRRAMYRAGEAPRGTQMIFGDNAPQSLVDFFTNNQPGN